MYTAQRFVKALQKMAERLERLECQGAAPTHARRIGALAIAMDLAASTGDDHIIDMMAHVTFATGTLNDDSLNLVLQSLCGSHAPISTQDLVYALEEAGQAVQYHKDIFNCRWDDAQLACEAREAQFLAGCCGDSRIDALVRMATFKPEQRGRNTINDFFTVLNGLFQNEVYT